MSLYDISSGGMTVSGDPKRYLPLTPAAFQVLVALADGELHGYALLKAVERQTGGDIRLSTGTLYGLINRFLADGLVGEKTSRDGKRTYRLTPFGRGVARGEADRLEALLRTARATRALRRSAT